MNKNKLRIISKQIVYACENQEITSDKKIDIVLEILDNITKGK